jgi:hypothetical protein
MQPSSKLDETYDPQITNENKPVQLKLHHRPPHVMPAKAGIHAFRAKSEKESTSFLKKRSKKLLLLRAPRTSAHRPSP